MPEAKGCAGSRRTGRGGAVAIAATRPRCLAGLAASRGHARRTGPEPGRCATHCPRGRHRRARPRRGPAVGLHHHVGDGAASHGDPDSRPPRSVEPAARPAGSPRRNSGGQLTPTRSPPPWPAYLAGRVEAPCWPPSTMSAPGRPGPSASGARRRPAASSRSTSSRPCSPGTRSACRRPTRRVPRSMIENSSNAAATALWNRVGASGGPALLQRAVRRAASRPRPRACLVCAGFAWPGWGLTRTTPADQLLLLRELVIGSALLS